MKRIIQTLTQHRLKLQLIAIGLPLIASFIAYLLIANVLIPSTRLSLITSVITLQIIASFIILCLLFLLSTQIRQNPLRSSLQILSWLAYAATFIFFSTAVMSLGDLFGPYYKLSYAYPDQNKQLHLFEQDCWIDGKTECPDFHTLFYLQKTPSPFMSEAADCPCYFETAPQQIGNTLELVATVCNDNKERTLLFDLTTGEFNKNVCD